MRRTWTRGEVPVLSSLMRNPQSHANVGVRGTTQAQDHAFLSKCSTKCSDKCIYNTGVRKIAPQPDDTGPVDVSTLLRSYKDSHPNEVFRPPLQADLPSDVKKLKDICFCKGSAKEPLEAIDARRQSIDILQLHASESSHYLTNRAQQTMRLLGYKAVLSERSPATY